MHKQELDKNYLNWETNFKKKVLINTNYVLGIMAVLECLSKYQVYSFEIYVYLICRKEGQYFAGRTQHILYFCLGHSLDRSCHLSIFHIILVPL